MTDKIQVLAQSIASALENCEIVMTVSGGLLVGDRVVTQKIGADSAAILSRHIVAKVGQEIESTIEERVAPAVEWAEDLLKWSEAYPTTIFTEPTPEQVDAVCKTLGFRIDRISAMVLREYTGIWGRKARAFLESLEVKP